MTFAEILLQLQYGPFPKNLIVNLARKDIGVEGACALAKVFASGHFSKGLIINLTRNNIDSTLRDDNYVVSSGRPAV